MLVYFREVLIFLMKLFIGLKQEWIVSPNFGGHDGVGAPKLEGPRGKNPTSLYGQSVAGHKQH
jgi:hypothetical protein